MRTHSRRVRFGISIALVVTTLLGSLAVSGTTAASAAKPRTGALGSVSGAPDLPDGFAETFESHYVHANGIRQHVVIGGEGPPLLLVHGWPQSWYAWRLVMPALAEHHTVIAVDQRGIGLTQRTSSGYDSATLATDLAALMTELGHQRFAVVGHDTGLIIAYALAADHRDRVDRLAVAEIPGPPGAGDPREAPPLFLPDALNDKLWHIPFNRVDDELIVDMVSSHADAYYRYEFSIQGGGTTLPDDVIDHYVDLYTRSRRALRATFGLYRAWDVSVMQNAARQSTKLTIPVLAIGGENSWGGSVGHGMEAVATDVQTLVVPGSGHWVAEQAPERLVEALDAFLAPYRAGGA